MVGSWYKEMLLLKFPERVGDGGCLSNSVFGFVLSVL